MLSRGHEVLVVLSRRKDRKAPAIAHTLEDEVHVARGKMKAEEKFPVFEFDQPKRVVGIGLSI